MKVYTNIEKHFNQQIHFVSSAELKLLTKASELKAKLKRLEDKFDKMTKRTAKLESQINIVSDALEEIDKALGTFPQSLNNNNALGEKQNGT